jgi:group I intron endonuclease
MIPSYKTDRIPGIYLFVNRRNGKRYVGQSKDMYNRFYRHRELKDNMIFGRALAKHGWDAFEWSIIERMPEGTKDDLNQREQHWILHYRSNERSFGYNLTLPLNCPRRRENAMRNLRRINAEGLNKGNRYPITNMTRLLMSDAKKGLKRTDAEKAHLREQNLGEKNHFFGKHHKRSSIEQGNRARELTAFLNPTPHPDTIHIKTIKTDTGEVDYIPLTDLAKRLHMDRKALKKRIEAQTPIVGYQLAYATADEVTAWLKELRQRRAGCVYAYGTLTYW